MRRNDPRLCASDEGMRCELGAGTATPRGNYNNFTFSHIYLSIKRGTKATLADAEYMRHDIHAAETKLLPSRPQLAQHEVM